MTYLAKFDSDGRRGATYPCDSTITPQRKDEMLADGYIEISEEDWEYYVGNKGTGANGTGYIRGADGKPTDAPAYVPSKEEQLAQLDAQYDAEKAELIKYYSEALIVEDADLQAELKAELGELDADYVEQRKAIEKEE